MGVLRRQSDGSLVPLPARLLIGRARTSGLRLHNTAASGEHASIVWTGDHWDVRDLGSTNGTLVDQTRLDPGKPHKIAPGATILFGDADETWILDDDAAPDALAIDVSSHEVVAKAGLLGLPSAIRR
jgi:predicted component of type VI protein secretion system